MPGKAILTSTRERDKMPPKELRDMVVQPAENGGASIVHRFTHYEHPDEMHVFGENDGKEFVAHLAKHTGIKVKGLDLNEESQDDDNEPIAPKK